MAVSSPTSTRTSLEQPRWSEIRIYRTLSRRYVTELVGRSTVAGERDRIRVQVHATPSEVIDALRRTSSDGGRYLTRLALEALDTAAGHDRQLRPVQVI